MRRRFPSHRGPEERWRPGRRTTSNCRSPEEEEYDRGVIRGAGGGSPLAGVSDAGIHRERHTQWMDQDVDVRRGGPLIEGGVGPFYVAMNAATFYLIAAIYLVASIGLAVALRGRAPLLRLGLAIFIPFETGLLAHIYVEKLAGWSRRGATLLHLAVSLLSIPLALLTLR
jgi:hypothetical protein